MPGMIRAPQMIDSAPVAASGHSFAHFRSQRGRSLRYDSLNEFLDETANIDAIDVRDRRPGSQAAGFEQVVDEPGEPLNRRSSTTPARWRTRLSGYS